MKIVLSYLVSPNCDTGTFYPRDQWSPIEDERDPPLS